MPKLIVANWKSHKTREQIEHWIDEFEKSRVALSLDSVELALAPPLPSVMFVSNRLLSRQKHPATYLAVQDLSPFPAGAYTGAVSTENLSGFNVRYALVGHSERRRYFHETHQEVANKVDQALQAGIKPIVCVDAEYIKLQAAAISREQLAKVMVAYEPLEAIGSGIEEPTDKVSQAVEAVKQAFGSVPVLYGGSVSAANVARYLSVSDGAIVGTHSLDVQDFTKLLTAAL